MNEKKLPFMKSPYQHKAYGSQEDDQNSKTLLGRFVEGSQIDMEKIRNYATHSCLYKLQLCITGDYGLENDLSFGVGSWLVFLLFLAFGQGFYRLINVSSQGIKLRLILKDSLQVMHFIEEVLHPFGIST